MDATLPIALATSPQAALPDMAETPPWEIEPAEMPRPIRVAPRNVAQRARRGEAPERIHWSVMALTLLTAVVVVFGARGEEGSHSWVMASAVQPN